MLRPRIETANTAKFKMKYDVACKGATKIETYAPLHTSQS